MSTLSRLQSVILIQRDKIDKHSQHLAIEGELISLNINRLHQLLIL